MDVVINSQIQSPLVRTLARTKGKSQSFTHNIADNVAPCSFSKIQLAAQNQGETQYGRNYKIKIPQYGYLRDVILKFTTRERAIAADVVSVAQSLYKFNYVSLEDMRFAGSTLKFAQPNKADITGSEGGVTYSGTRGISEMSWYNMQNIVLNNPKSGYSANTLDFAGAQQMGPYLAPQFDRLLGYASGLTTVTTGNNGFANFVTTGTTPTLVNRGDASGGATGITGNDASTPGPYTQLLKLNGGPDMWNAINRLYYSIYQLAIQSTIVNNVTVWTHPLARMVWDALTNEPIQYVQMPIYSSQGVTAPLPLVNGVITSTTGNISALTTNVAYYVNCALPRTATAISRGGETYWVPKIPQLRWDANGTCVGVDFVPLHLMHPNDNGDSASDIALLAKLSTDPSKALTNYRQFSIGSGGGRNDDFNTWDWQSESYYYPGLVANIPDRVQLSTHNRPIQTIFPQETLARIQMLDPAERTRYTKMMQARVCQTGKPGTAPGEKCMYLPLFLSSTENPSLNFDTRFVEQLDIDVMTNAIDKIFVSSDVSTGAQSSLTTLKSWIDSLRSSIFNFDWAFTVSGTTTYGPQAALPAAGTFAVFSTPASISLRADLIAPSAVDLYPSSYGTYQALSVRSYVLGLRNFQSVPDNYIKVEALTYFHNFHDATAQAIRDSNFKPGVPASLLSYNTYAETVRPITLKELQNTSQIQVLLTTNNLVNGTTFFARRRYTNVSLANKRDHLMQTLPIKSATLTASGQQLYTAELDEAQLTDVFHYPLASGAIGRKYNRANISQALADPLTGESYYVYHIPFSFSSDLTYNSGSVAFQTLNNPVLTVTIDVGSGASRPFNVTGSDSVPEWELVVFHTYWQMVRIDSNTGAITRSLDL
jgi:hypothetical protein